MHYTPYSPGGGGLTNTYLIQAVNIGLVHVITDDFSSCENVVFLVMEATVFCSSTIEVKQKLFDPKLLCRAPILVSDRC